MRRLLSVMNLAGDLGLVKMLSSRRRETAGSGATNRLPSCPPCLIISLYPLFSSVFISFFLVSWKCSPKPKTLLAIAAGAASAASPVVVVVAAVARLTRLTPCSLHRTPIDLFLILVPRPLPRPPPPPLQPVIGVLCRAPSSNFVADCHQIIFS